MTESTRLCGRFIGDWCVGWSCVQILVIFIVVWSRDRYEETWRTMRSKWVSEVSHLSGYFVTG